MGTAHRATTTIPIDPIPSDLICHLQDDGSEADCSSDNQDDAIRSATASDISNDVNNTSQTEKDERTEAN